MPTTYWQSPAANRRFSPGADFPWWVAKWVGGWMSVDNMPDSLSCTAKSRRGLIWPFPVMGKVSHVACVGPVATFKSQVTLVPCFSLKMLPPYSGLNNTICHHLMYGATITFEL